MLKDGKLVAANCSEIAYEISHKSSEKSSATCPRNCRSQSIQMFNLTIYGLLGSKKKAETQTPRSGCATVHGISQLQGRATAWDSVGMNGHQLLLSQVGVRVSANPTDSTPYISPLDA